MPVPIHIEDPDEGLTQERCCFCREPTHWWTSLNNRTLGHQVAICEHCASRASPMDVPSKVDWCRRERIAHRPTIGELARGQDCTYPPAPVVQPLEKLCAATR